MKLSAFNSNVLLIQVVQLKPKDLKIVLPDSVDLLHGMIAARVLDDPSKENNLVGKLILLQQFNKHEFGMGTQTFWFCGRDAVLFTVELTNEVEVGLEEIENFTESHNIVLPNNKKIFVPI